MEFLTSGRDEVLSRVLNGISALITAAETIKHDEENFHRFAEYMIHVRELLPKLQGQRATIESARLLLVIEAEINKAGEVIDGYKSKNRLFRHLNARSVASKLNHSFKEIYAVLQLISFTQINPALNIKEAADAMIQGFESIHLNISNNSNAIVSIFDQYFSENRGNQQQPSHSLFMIARSKGIASSSVCPLPIQIVAQESEGERPLPTQIEAHESEGERPFESYFFLCPLACAVMEDPVSVSCDHSFERKAIDAYFRAGQNFCPICSKELSSTGKLELTSNSTLRNSILEWKKREDQINAERNAKKKFIDAAAKITLDNMESTNQALGDLHALMMEIPSCIAVATESSCKLVSKLAELLMNNSSDNTSTILKCLLLIARFSDENKEMIGKRGVIKCLLNQSMTEPDGVAVLLELSGNRVVAGKIGGIPYSISILVSLLDNPSSAVAEMARMVLENLSFDINFIVMMAESGYFTPFLERFNSQEISDEIRAYMAAKLAQIQLTETSAKNLTNERFILHLTEMLRFDSPSIKMASLNCINHLTPFNELKTFFLQTESAIPALLHLTTSPSIDIELKQKALDILISLVPTTRAANHGFFRPLFSPDGVPEMLNRIENSPPEYQLSLLRLLLAMVRSSDVAGEWVFSDDNVMRYLFSAINTDGGAVKMNAVKLIYHIASENDMVIPLPSSPSKSSIVTSLISILADDDLFSAAAAAGILIHLPPDDETINEMLQSSAALKPIHSLITRSINSHSSLENALGALLRCASHSRSSSKFRKKVSADLIEILSAGSPLAKRRAAAILARLSRPAADSSLPTSSSSRRHFLHMRRLSREGGACPVHKSGCFVCLVMDKAVAPLIEMAKSMEVGPTEAALAALDTLFDDGCDVDGAAAAIVGARGASPILDVLERGEASMKEKALELFSKIYEHPGVSERELERFKGLVLNLVRKEGGLKIRAEKLMKELF